jgi:UDP-glucose 4-epimerase
MSVLPTTALVTGAAGFIGSHLAERLAQRGMTVVGLDDLSGGFRENVPHGVTFVQGSTLDAVLLEKLFATHKFDHVFHFAAYAAEGLSHFVRRFNYENNLLGSVGLINLSIRYNVKCFVFASSIAVYGEAPTPMREDGPTRPVDPYGIAKLAVEMDLATATRQFGMPHVIFRAHNVYGERQNIGDRYRNVVGIFMNQILQGKPLTLFGDGSQTRAFSYVADIMDPIASCVTNPAAHGQVFNIGGDTATSVGQLAERVLAVMGSSMEIIHVPAREEVHHAFASHEKLHSVFGNGTVTSLDDGLTRMATWVKQHGPRSSKAFTNIEINRGLPSVWL